MAAPLAGHAHAALSAARARQAGPFVGAALRAFGVVVVAAASSCVAAALAADARAADAAAAPTHAAPAQTATPATPAMAGPAAVPGATADPLSDAPEGDRPSPPGDVPNVTSYDEALVRWRSAADVEAWLGRHFRYDMARALQLSESQRQRQGTLPIAEPAAFFARPSGVCVDVARFGVETLRRIDPTARARYLMIEFDPLTLAGQTLRRHWVAMVEVDGQRYVFADSKRPGVVAGPYADTQAFIDEYARYRGRRIVAFQERASFERQLRRAAPAPAPAPRREP